MPFKSQAQRAYMFIHLPSIAKKWAEKYGPGKNLPKHVNKSRVSAKKHKLYKKK